MDDTWSVLSKTLHLHYQYLIHTRILYISPIQSAAFNLPRNALPLVKYRYLLHLPPHSQFRHPESIHPPLLTKEWSQQGTTTTSYPISSFIMPGELIWALCKIQLGRSFFISKYPIPKSSKIPITSFTNSYAPSYPHPLHDAYHQTPHSPNSNSHSHSHSPPHPTSHLQKESHSMVSFHHLLPPLLRP